MPRRITRLGDWVEVGAATWNACVRAEIGCGAAVEGYALRIRRGEDGRARVEFEADAAAGERHALATLAQIERAFPPGSRVPCVMIEDWPAFTKRGLMLDVSRNRVPTNGQLRRVVDLLARLKMNHLQLYTEHTFAYAGHEEAWRGASPITPGEIRSLDEYARERGVELAANQNCFGHLSSWLKLPRYAHLAEIEGDGAWRFMSWERRGPFSLCPTDPRAIEFVSGLLHELLPCFSSPLVNIGCDETFDVGWGRSRAEVQRRAALAQARDGQEQEPALAKARAELYFEFTAAVCGLVNAKGKRPMFWADIALHHPEMLDRMPSDAVALAWGYEPDAKFADWASVLRERGGFAEVWVCPGTSSWRSITGRTTEARANLVAAARQGIAAGAAGYLACDWGDVGHMQSWLVSLPRIADAAEAAWGGGAAECAEPAAVALQVFDDGEGRTLEWLDRLGDADLLLRRRAHAAYSPDPSSEGIKNASAIFNDLFPPAPPRAELPAGTRAIVAERDAFERVADELRELERARPRFTDPLLDDEARHTAAFAVFAAEHAVAHRTGAGTETRERLEGPLRSSMSQRAEGLLSEHRRLWGIRARPGGLDESCAHLRRVCEKLR